MANAIKGETPLVLSDGREFTLVLDMEALVEAETIYGKPLSKLMEDAMSGFMGAAAAMLQGAAARHHGLKRGDALEIIRTDMGEVVEALTRASESAFPDEVEAGNAPAPKPKAKKPRGKTSGRNGAKQG
ncbi:hypothetical protein CMI47_05190 [Candidatus Pacearchaeota archaeon]|jgi:bifunctional DNA-binding transcriptional regulator/antitoxin component of YhaV-PrlF toxin-antitoxin module|nr:hypothetical protein [Candidatus Pacearchaeota archaeon]|tara:strand:- start:9914 stop:10300 length:387 start_codon:yes stop_codon:yes gene_type:complete